MARKNILINSGAAGIREVAENSLNSNFIELYARSGASVTSDATLSYITEDNPNGSVSAGDLLGVWEVAASGASDHHAITAGGVKLYEAGPNFSTRARAVAWIARGGTAADGTVISWPDVSAVASSGATALPALTGMKFYGTAQPQHFGDGANGWHEEINTAIEYLNSIGGGELQIPKIEGDYECDKIVLRENVTIKGIGRPRLYLGDGANTTLCETLDFAAEHAAEAGGGQNRVRIEDVVFDGNRDNNTSPDAGQGHGLAIYGRGIYLRDVACIRAKRSNLITSWDSGGNIYDDDEVQAWNSRAFGVSLDRCGEHNWLNRVSDFQVVGVNARAASMDAAETWDQLHLLRSMRLANVNCWSSEDPNWPLRAIYANAGTNITNAHLESAKVLYETGVGAVRNIFEGYLYNGRGTTNAILAGNFNHFKAHVVTGFWSTTVGVQIGKTGSQASHNIVEISGEGMTGGIVDFVNSGGYNRVKGGTYALSGSLIAGTPGSHDLIDLSGLIGSTQQDRQKRIAVYSGLVATGSTQGDAALIVQHITRVTGADGTKGVILPDAGAGAEFKVLNDAASNLLVYPPVDCFFSGLAANSPITLAAREAATLTSFRSSNLLWGVCK